MFKLAKYLKIILFSCVLTYTVPVCAMEITAIDFNGNIIGQVISTGLVINGNGENIGTITADSLIVNNEGDIIGGVVPQGIAIGMDNRFLGKIHGDGVVRSLGGKDLGKTLPNGLIINAQSEVIGAVLYPGLVYSPSGQTIGRVTGAGVYTNLDGKEIGFISANGYAYRKTGEEYVLDGRLISSKMVVSQQGKFIGSLAPTGKIIDFEGKEIGTIHANNFAYNDQGEIFGRMVNTSYAFDLTGKYVGLVTYNGEVSKNGRVIGYYRADGNIVDANGNVVGFAVDISAVANDNMGRFLGRVVPGGNVVYGSSVVGRVGARGYIYRDSKRIGEIVKTGPVYDVLAHLKGQIMKNGTVISLAGAAIGRAHGRFAFDSNGTLMGGTTSDMLAIDNNNIPFGLINADSSVKKGNDTGLISPFGYVFNSAGSVIGKSFEPYAVYGVEGLLFSYITPNGYIYYNDQSARLTPSGVLLNKKGYVGGVVNPLYALNFNGNLLGIETQSNIIANNQGEPSYKILPGGYVVGNQKAINNAVAPIEGFAHRKMIALNINGNLLGYIDGNAVVYDLGGNSYGRVIYDDYIQDNNNVVVGKAVPFATVNNDKCNAVGVVNGRGDIVNNREVIIGRLLPNGQAISDVGSYVGYATLASGLIDFDGNYVGTVSAGKGIDINGKTLGCVNRQGQIVDGNKRVLYGVVESNPVINFDGNVIGDVMANGTVADDKNQIIGYIQPNGSVVSKSKKNIGQTMKYRVAYNNDNQFIGMVQHNGLVYEQSGEIIGQVMFDGSIQKRGEVIGYALYDFYVYDDSFVTHGYLTKDGTVLSSVGSKLGTVDRGFMVDKNDKVIARGNRDYVVRDASNNAVGELQMDGNVIDFDGKNIGYLAENGAILNSAGDEIAHARPLQYYSPRAKDETPAPAAQPEKKPEDQDWVDKKKVKITDIEDGKVVERPSEDEQTGKRGGSRVVGIALNPEGDIIGNIYDDDSVKADDGTQIGFRTPDGMVVDMNYNPIGIEEVKRVSAENMFVPADAFGNGNPYGIGTQPSNLGPGGGYGQGERYDRVRASALQQVQNQRRRNISVGKISTNIKVSSFTGYEEHGWPGMTPNKSTWRVDMSEMILQDKAIPAVLARSVYASEGFSTNIPITAIVERNIYAEEGRNIIIPAGSRVIGSLAGGGGEGSGGNSGGAVKIGITWNRLIRPDGSQFTFNSAQTADAQGRAGAIGYLDEQLIKKYSMPMLYTALETATAMTLAGGEGSKTTEGGTTTESSRSQALEDARQNFIDQMNNIFSDLLNRKKNIRSVTYIPAGTRIIIFPNEDLWLNSEKLEGIGSEGGNPDDGIGLTTDRPDEEGGAGNVSYSGNVQENVTPVQGGGNGAPNRPTGGVTPPPSVEATQGSDNSEDDIPDLM